MDRKGLESDAAREEQEGDTRPPGRGRDSRTGLGLCFAFWFDFLLCTEGS